MDQNPYESPLSKPKKAPRRSILSRLYVIAWCAIIGYLFVTLAVLAIFIVLREIGLFR